MPTKETKEWALNTAIQITTKAAEGGYAKNTLSNELENLYDSLIRLHAKLDTEN